MKENVDEERDCFLPGHRRMTSSFSAYSYRTIPYSSKSRSVRGTTTSIPVEPVYCLMV